jgi:ADP-ribose pyrophosphatase YjhB (NUDIX family)/predicted transcriptional regulator
MTSKNKLHEVQTAILRELLFHKSMHFADLQKPTDLTSDHFNFHITKLIELGLVEKIAKGEYRLTAKGEEFANKMDTDTHEFERQPKISVLLRVERTNAAGETEYLLQQRLKQPFYGFWGMMGGKVRWGDSFEETAARELLEETGLRGDFEFLSVYRKRDYDKAGALLEDKVFVRMRAIDPGGKLVADFEGGHNEWLTLNQIKKIDKTYGGTKEFVEILTSQKNYFATEYEYDEIEY